MDALNQMMEALRKKHSNQESEQTLQDLTEVDKCELCGGDEWVSRIDEEGIERYSPCICRQKHIYSSRIRFAELPEAFKNVKMQNFNINAYKQIESRNRISIACKAIKYYLDNFEEMKGKGMGLYLYSDTKGSGKTRMAASIANFLLESYQVKFATSPNILSEIKATYEKNKSPNADIDYTERKLLELLTSTDILFIDDFGTERVSDWVDEKFYEIINQRYSERKVTIFTSNMSLSNTEYDARITNRIKERCYEIQFPDESIRNYIAEKNSEELIKKLR